MKGDTAIRAGLRLGLCAAVIVSALGCGPAVRVIVNGSQGNFSFANYRNATAKTKAQAPIGTARELQVSTDFGAIEVDAAVGQEVTVEAEVTASGPYARAQLQGWAKAAQIKIAPAGNRLEVRLQRPSGVPQDASLAASYRIRAPKQLALDLQSSNGKVISRGVGGSVRAESTFGAVTVTDVQGSVVARSSNGSVTVERVAGDVDADSTFGAVALKEIQGSVRGHSSNGRVAVRDVRADQKPVDLTSDFGAVEFAGTAGTLSAKSDNGSVKVALENTPRDTQASSSFGAVEATLPSGADADVEADTDFGKVSMENMRAAISSSSGEHQSARLGNGGSMVKLHSSNGSVTVRQR